MKKSKFEFSEILKLLRRSENDAVVRSFFGANAMASIERDEYYGSLEFKPEGVDVVFNEAAWVLPPGEVSDPKLLYVSAFHLHRQGHESYAGYKGELPNGVSLDDLEALLIRKMGRPDIIGGGGMSTLLKRPIPRWLRYSIGNIDLHFQLDGDDRIEMVTPTVPLGSENGTGLISI